MDKKKQDKVKVRSNQYMTGLKNSFNGKNIPFVYPALIILVINIALIVTLILISSHLPPLVPLFYGFPRGEHQLATPLALILPLSISSLFIAINCIFAYFTKSVFLKNTLVIGGFFSSLLAIITIVKIILLTVNIL